MSSMLSSKQLGDLLDDHGLALENYARQWTLSPEDCVQEAFVRLATQEPPPERCVAWLFRVVRNVAINQMRSEKRRRHHESNLARDASNSLTKNSDVDLDDYRHLEVVLNQLPADQREMVTLRIWGKLTWEEIGTVMDLSTSHAHRIYSAGIKKLQLLWGNYV